jgi:UDP-N-acetyl-D-mannosaminuronic acid transferase (WecB/TagA/CpsF family)
MQKQCDRVNILGVQITNIHLHELINHIEETIKSQNRMILSYANIHTLNLVLQRELV